VLGLALLVACTGQASPPAPTTPEPGPVVSPDRGGWTELADAPTARQEVAAAVLDGLIYVAGGLLADGTATDVVEYYDPGVNVWRPAAALPLALHHAMGAAFGDAFVVAGGFTADGTASDRVFGLRDGVWEELPAMPVARGAGGAAVARGMLVVTGGQTGDALVEPTAVFDGEEWSTAAAIPTPRDHLVVATDGRFVYAAGGRRRAIDATLDAFERFDPRSGTWSALDSLPVPRGGAGGAFLDGRLALVGGEGGPAANAGGVVARVDLYVSRSGEWERATGLDMTEPRHGVGAVAIGPTLYVAAGGTVRGLGPSASFEAFRPAGEALLKLSRAFFG